MRLLFAGTPDFAVPALDALVQAGHSIVGVYTQPDRPAGRGQKLQASPVARRAAELGLTSYKPAKLTAEAVTELRVLKPEAMVVVAYGLILPQAVLDIPVHGCLNIHASLLPRWRGAAPIQRAILAGDPETGITIMRMEAGLDTGPMLLRETLPIAEDATAGDLHDALAVMGARLIVQALEKLGRGELRETPQPAEGATYARKISKDEARLDWTLPAAELARRVRAYNPVPIAWAELDEERLRIHAARALPAYRGGGIPGEVLDVSERGIAVGTGDGALMIERLQRPGGRVLETQQAVKGWNPLGKQFR